MPTNTDDNDHDDDTLDQGDQEPNWRRKLEADAKAGREAAAAAAATATQNLQLQRELAMVRAGVDLDSPMGQMFSKGYEGEFNAEAVREEYARITGNVGSGQPQVDQQAMARIGQALQGGTPSGGTAPNFEAELDSIPLLSPDGNYNPDYVNQVLAKTAEQAAREGRQFNVLGNKASKWTKGSGSATSPSVNPL